MSEIYSMHPNGIYAIRLLKRLIKKNFHSPIKVIDLGCGFGSTSLELAKAFPESVFVLVDNRIECIEFIGKQCIRNNIENVIPYCDDIKNFSGFYDLIIFSHVIEHMESGVRGHFCRKVVDSVAPGGLLYVATPHRDIDKMFTLVRLKHDQGHVVPGFTEVQLLYLFHGLNNEILRNRIFFGEAVSSLVSFITNRAGGSGSDKKIMKPTWWKRMAVRLMSYAYDLDYLFLWMKGKNLIMLGKK